MPQEQEQSEVDLLLDRKVAIRLNEDQIRQMLDLPEGTRVRAIQSQFDPPSIEIVVVHPDLPVQPRDSFAPRRPAMLMVERKEDDAGTVWHRSTISWDF